MADRVGLKSVGGKIGLTSRLGLQYPIIQGPLRVLVLSAAYGGRFGTMEGSDRPALTALGRRRSVTLFAQIAGLTPKPFAMNLWVSMEDEGAWTSTEEAFHRSLAPLAKHIESVGGAKPTYLPYEPIRFEDQVQVLLDVGILRAFSFIC